MTIQQSGKNGKGYELPLDHQILIFKNFHQDAENKIIPHRQSQEYKETNTVLSGAKSQTLTAIVPIVVAPGKRVSSQIKNMRNKPFYLLYDLLALKPQANSEVYEVTSFRISTREVVRRGGDVKEAATDKYLAIQENNSNFITHQLGHNAYSVWLYQQRSAETASKGSLAQMRNIHHPVGILSSETSTTFWSIGFQIIIIHAKKEHRTCSVFSKTQTETIVDIRSPTLSEACQLRRVNSKSSSRYSVGGYAADQEDLLQESVFRERIVLRHMTRSVLPRHLQQPLGFEWELSDSDSSNEATLFFAVPLEEDSNSEKDYNVVAVRKRRRKSKKIRNSLKKQSQDMLYLV